MPARLHHARHPRQAGPRGRSRLRRFGSGTVSAGLCTSRRSASVLWCQRKPRHPSCEAGRGSAAGVCDAPRTQRRDDLSPIQVLQRCRRAMLPASTTRSQDVRREAQSILARKRWIRTRVQQQGSLCSGPRRARAQTTSPPRMPSPRRADEIPRMSTTMIANVTKILRAGHQRCAYTQRQRRARTIPSRRKPRAR
jgi:hypothetical protein